MSKSEKRQKSKATPQCNRMEVRTSITTQEGMPYGENCITGNSDTQVLFWKASGFYDKCTQRRTQEIIVASCAKENSGKMTDYA